MRPLFKALISTIAYVCIIAVGFIVIIGIVRAIDWLWGSGYSIHAVIGFILLVFIFNYFQARKEQIDPEHE